MPDAAQSVDATDSTDAAVDADLGTKITILTFGSPATAIAYRDGVTAPWQTPATTATGYEMTVHGPYVVSNTCASADGNVSTDQIARTPDDPTTLGGGCGSTPVSTVHVTGHMVQAGTVSVGGAPQRSQTASWDFDIEVPTGTYDVIAQTADRIEIRRDLAIAAATPLTPAFDVDAHGTDLLATQFTVSGAASDDQLSQLTSVQTTHGFALLGTPPAGPDMQKAVPKTLLKDTEFHKLLISAFAFLPEGGQPYATRRVRRRWNPGQSTTFAFPARLGPISYAVTSGTLVATWSTVPDFYEADGELMSHNADFSKFTTISITASKRFIDASAAKLTFDVDIPGFMSEWRIDYTKEYTRELTVLTSRGATTDDRDESTAAETANEGQSPVAPHGPRPAAASRR